MANALSKKPVRPAPWNVTFELGSNMQIELSGFVCTRKNKATDMKKALVKNVPVVAQQSASNGNSAVSSQKPQNNVTAGSSLRATPDLDVAKDATTKESFWKQDDGEAVDEEDVGKAYYFGDKLIPFNGKFTHASAKTVRFIKF